MDIRTDIVEKYHSMKARGEDVEKVLKEAQKSNNSRSVGLLHNQRKAHIIVEGRRWIMKQENSTKR